jgi:hypothetical protein
MRLSSSSFFLLCGLVKKIDAPLPKQPDSQDPGVARLPPAVTTVLYIAPIRSISTSTTSPDLSTSGPGEEPDVTLGIGDDHISGL